MPRRARWAAPRRPARCSASATRGSRNPCTGELECRGAERDAGRLDGIHQLAPHRPQLVVRHALQDRDPDDRKQGAVGGDHPRRPGRGHERSQVRIREPRRRGERRSRHREPDREGDEEVEEFRIEPIQSMPEPLQSRRRQRTGVRGGPIRPRAPRGVRGRRTGGCRARGRGPGPTCVVGRRIAEQFGRPIADVGHRQVLQHEVRALPAESIDESGHRLRARPRPEGDDDVRSVRPHEAREHRRRHRRRGAPRRRSGGRRARGSTSARPYSSSPRTTSIPSVRSATRELVEQRRLARASGPGDSGVHPRSAVEHLPHECCGVVPTDRARNPPSHRRERPAHGTDGGGSVGSGVGSGTGSGSGAGIGRRVGCGIGHGLGLRCRVRHRVRRGIGHGIGHGRRASGAGRARDRAPAPDRRPGRSTTTASAGGILRGGRRSARRRSGGRAAAAAVRGRQRTVRAGRRRVVLGGRAGLGLLIHVEDRVGLRCGERCGTGHVRAGRRAVRFARRVGRIVLRLLLGARWRAA